MLRVNDCPLVLAHSRKHSADVEVSVSFGGHVMLLFDHEGLLEKLERGVEVADPSVVACKIIESHGLGLLVALS